MPLEGCFETRYIGVMQKRQEASPHPTPQKLPKRGLEDIFPTPTVLLKDICPKFRFEFAEITGKQLRCPG